jgi:hypothetical protein
MTIIVGSRRISCAMASLIACLYVFIGIVSYSKSYLLCVLGD